MCNKAVELYPWRLYCFIPDHFKAQVMCNKAVEENPWTMRHVPNHFKTQKMCNKAVQREPKTLEFIPHCFVTQRQTDLWHQDYYRNKSYIIKWFEGYQKRKAQKAQIEKELMPIAWHPSRWWDWCVPQDEKIGIEKLWAWAFLYLMTKYKKFFWTLN